MAANREKTTKVAITARTKDEGDMLSHVARACGFDQIQTFSSPRVTAEVAKRNQFQLFITHHDFPDMTGLTMIQTLRSTGNYGIEPHLFLVDHLTPEIMLVLNENNITHVLAKPYSADRTHQKLMHLWKEETHMTPAEAEFREAHAAMNSGLMEMAQELAVKNLRAHGPSEKLLLLLGDVETKLNHASEARRYYDAAQKVNPKSSSAAQKLAQTYMLEKDFAKASELMNELTKLNPLNIELLANAGLSNFEVGNLDEAKDAMNRLQGLDKERKDASEVLAKVAIQEGDYDTAMKQLSGTHDHKELVQLLNNEGVRLSHNQDIDAAIAMYVKCIGLIGAHPYVYALHYNLALAYHKQNDNANAILSLRKALELKPGFEKAASVLSKLEPKSA
ncbi:MAG TPA: tetratricopeptide repeat protein [Oligoflexus sp.]|uniref:tetratricopeptide repeat protein n=1 Tax=Oligoflexus sp. TaxID=1971216 RepID=UPI002D34F8FC|nr:tetratricopeptide repeat protein [Oligoflexus sp.]HYX35450.1 tetratricopeptide repeat protein [Oligoflexus sp.]